MELLVAQRGRPEEELMTQAPVKQEVFRLDDGDVIITFPANISRSCVEDLKAQLICSLRSFAGPMMPLDRRTCAGLPN